MSERGLSAERTRLARQRTCLSSVVIAALIGRVGWAESGVAAVVAAAVALPLCVVALTTLRRTGRAPASNAGPFALLTAAIVVLACGEAILVLSD